MTTKIKIVTAIFLAIMSCIDLMAQEIYTGSPNYLQEDNGSFNWTGTQSNNVPASLVGANINEEVVVGGELDVDEVLEFETLLCKNSVTAILKLENKGDNGLKILSIQVQGILGNTFRLNENYSNLELAYGEEKEIKVNFNAIESGTYIDYLIIKTNQLNSKIFNVKLIGRKEKVDFKISKSIIDLGQIDQGQSAIGYLEVNNVSTIGLDFEVLNQYSDFEISPESFELSSGKAKSIQIKSSVSLLPGDYDAFIRIKENRCFTDREFQVKLKVKETIQPKKYKIEIGTISGKTGDIIEIPIRLDDPNELLSQGINRLKTSIKYNKTLLFPIEGTPNGNIDGEHRYIPIEFDILPNIDIQKILKFRATLGSDSTTSMIFDDTQPVGGGQANFQEESGLFRLTDLCYEGGIRIVSFSSPALLVVAPNPVTESSILKIRNIENGEVRISMSDIMGRSTRTLFSGPMNKGEYEINLDCQSSGSGIHIITFQTPTIVKTEIVNIIR